MVSALQNHPQPRRAALLRALFAALALAFVLFAPTDARAAGTVTLATREPEEVNGKWKLNFTINYGAKPDIAYIPMIFSFTPVVLYERSLTDQSPERPLLTRLPLKGQPSINESMDVGFSDASGKVFNITKFDFVIRRDKGFEAGEYDLKITRQTDGAQMGQTIKLILKGDNPIVDRRAMVFAGEKKKKPEEKKADAAGEKKEGEGEPAAAGGETPAEPAATGETPTEAPPAEPPKQGGCGCRVAGVPAPSSGASLAALLLGSAFVVRRRTARS
ncbi:MYXO-CTERM sorting domain-containing protein [Polyangium mundeleinium]|uniref:MYXO-CTERM sorting domain-containing protein n=1 Tax=Polyangium mundeleinium TaxID=2995306 RepID=A0ABT5EJQ8_9BACT|nr:MYXO-CTERM sorting domain-containing protein [Polyangium mundeleinium]MDC0742055.1 MYXO-CTERM sorting domain-containing protein [Polyangium mundeleinium]